MYVLALDTTGADCSVSIVDDAGICAHISRQIGRGHAEVLAGLVEEAFSAANLSPADIDRLAVCTGPGSFTGLRVALSFAIGFALPRDLPVIGMDALEVTANDVMFSHDDHLVGAMRDIRRGEVFYASYSHGVPLDPPHAMTMGAAEAQADELQAAIYEVKTVDTRILGWLAMDCEPANYPPEPLYSRGPDAKLPGGKSPAKPA